MLKILVFLLFRHFLQFRRFYFLDILRLGQLYCVDISKVFVYIFCSLGIAVV
jgi:hypothetical protein